MSRASLHLLVLVEIEVLANLVEDSADDLLLDRLRVGRVDVLVRAPPTVRDALLDRLDREQDRRGLSSHRAQVASVASSGLRLL
jgi:hypothetical protein